MGLTTMAFSLLQYNLVIARLLFLCNVFYLYWGGLCMWESLPCHAYLYEGSELALQTGGVAGMHN